MSTTNSAYKKDTNILFMHLKIAAIKSQILHSEDIENCLQQIAAANDFIESVYLKDSSNNLVTPVIISPYIWSDDFSFSPAFKNFNAAMKDYFLKLKSGVLECSITEPFISPFTERSCYTISSKLNSRYILFINIADFSGESNSNLKAV